MCGIFGQFNFKRDKPVVLDEIRRMTDTIRHRGPDDEGYHISGSSGLGFRRLSIIDLEGGHQPMCTQDRSVWVVFNGEIYNFQELRSELENYGHVFMTRSDTEVIVHGYKQWGVDVLSRLNGMFGLAVWDEKKKQLMLARDRMGIKLVYYKFDSEGLIFASEIKPLHALEQERPELDTTSLNLFLRYRYTPSPLTIFKGIFKLAPGTRLIVNQKACTVERWWNFKPEALSPMPDIEQAASELSELYSRAVKRQLVSDVPVGLLLSGGVDSALLLALMKKHGGNFKTFTVGYGKRFADDELSDGARTASLIGAENSSIEIDQDVFERDLPAVIASLEEPIASSSIVPMYHVCKFARREVKVALIGQGPDELLGGYKRHLGIRYGHYWRAVPEVLKAPAKKALSAIPRSDTISRGLYSLDIPQRIKRYQQAFSILPGQVVDSLFQDGLLPDGAGDKILDCWAEFEPLMENTDELGGLQFIEVRSSLPDELLMYADKLSMAHGLELRVPYLDHEVVEYIERLPAEYKVRYGKGKWLHKSLCKRFLPGEIIHRKKRGFAVNVVDEWFRNSLAGKLKSILIDDKSLMYNYLKPASVRQLLVDHQAGKRDNHKMLFSLAVFEGWLRGI